MAVRWMPIRVMTAAGDPLRPTAFWWRRRRYRVDRVQEQWQDAGAWWAGEAPRWFFRLEAEGGLYEVAADADGRRWWMYRIFD
ncbi:MAG: DUF6504 family protein [Actinomycetia bacterium]|nr:DUF6504 family protein [Actinomycetes bacterium]